MNELSRRHLLRLASLSGAAGLASSALPSWAQSGPFHPASRLSEVSGSSIDLTLDRAAWPINGKAGSAITINGTVPGPILRLKEGQRVRIAVTNRMDEAASIHWHGMLVPFRMDGVPGVTFPGIPARSTFVYEFPVVQSGTYWYHSHSGFQEQVGLYGPIVIDPKGVDPVQYDREYVVMLSDFSFLSPEMIIQRLKQEGGVFNYQRQTVASLLAGRDQTLAERLQWAKMLMDPTDISDVTGAIYTFLINGYGPEDNWTGLFRRGERIRLRFINAGAQMVFNVRIPGLHMTVVAADGQMVRPVRVDEFQIGNAETYDVTVQPMDDKAYTIVSEAVDRSGMGRATLAPRLGMTAPVPPLRERPLATMKDMGMDMSSMDMGDMDKSTGSNSSGMSGMSGMSKGVQTGAQAKQGMQQSGGMQGMSGMSGKSGMARMSSSTPPGMAPQKPRGSDLMSGPEMDMRDPKNAPGVKMGPGVQTIAPMPQDRTGDPGMGLESVGHRVLTYRDLIALERNPDPRTPTRALDIHLTGNMQKFMWGFDGEKFSETTKPYTFRKRERVRVTLINDSMMLHPIHLHGHFFEVVNGAPENHRPRKHTVNVLPGGKVSFDITAEPGDWAFHCHMLYHMHAGMFQVFSVRPLTGDNA
ncbi:MULTISPECIES: copper resistance system multicopper oxidase [unclassified Bradyrhizobium]|uniref:copper resistance system multicopper oxidase n=1 Tax=unclassified Bradyrhizobium TaxID=2631580 RepID=UPI00070BCE20|nr:MULTISPECIES: copper resistance system multicopper oxidase [unclassified Bradyrhizobium]KQT20311.1 copper-binding protein [Bradyrhizobium sp. Leaf396]